MRAVLALGLLAVVLGACGDDDSGGGGGASLYSTELKEGIATYYDADGSGNCSFEKSPDDLDVVALNPTEYGASAACGGCMRVKGESGEVTVRVVDSCPGCGAGHLDLSREAFAKIAPLPKGRVPITYQTVACAVTGSLAFHFKDGSSKFWTAIQVRNHRVPVSKLEYQRDGAYVDMKRESYNYFVASEGVGDQPGGLRLRVTSADGQVVEETLPGTVPDDEVVSGTKQFN